MVEYRAYYAKCDILTNLLTWNIGVQRLADEDWPQPDQKILNNIFNTAWDYNIHLDAKCSSYVENQILNKQSLNHRLS